jgi:hypothetical protein
METRKSGPEGEMPKWKPKKGKGQKKKTWDEWEVRSSEGKGKVGRRADEDGGVGVTS